MSAEVANEFMSMNASGFLYTSRICSTWRAMKSRKVLPCFRSSSDLAFSRPMPVPRPPLSFTMTQLSSSAGFSAVSAA